MQAWPHRGAPPLSGDDLKPTNVLLNADGHAVVTDFGIATSAPEASTFCGTPHYLAPGQKPWLGKVAATCSPKPPSR